MSVQIVHCSDLHLDRNFNFGNSRRESERKQDINRNFSEVVNFCLSNRPDLLLISGDIFDKVSPTNYSRAFLTEKIRQVHEAGIKVFLIGGNHDVPKIPTSTSLAIDTIQSAGLGTVFSNSREMQRRVLRLEGEEVCIAGKSFNTQNVYENPLKDYHLQLDGKYNVIILHGSLSGMNVSSSVPEYTNQNAFTGDDVRSGLDYLALGHYHNHFERSFKGCRIANPGSIERLTWGEENDIKGFIWAELGPSETKTEFHKLETRPMESVEIELSTELKESMYDRIITSVSMKSDISKLLRMNLRGVVSQDQFSKLRWIELYKTLGEMFFATDVDKSDLQVEGFGRIFLGKVDTPVDAFSKRLDRLITLAEPRERELLAAVRELGIKHLVNDS